MKEGQNINFLQFFIVNTSFIMMFLDKLYISNDKGKNLTISEDVIIERFFKWNDY